ncbi:MAG: hypothetical protein NXI32_24010, partial [bacterium]|nr:hypothetical protein [bacterium]
MVGFAARYLKALVAILIAMGVYVVTVARWIEPQNVNAERSTLVSRKLPDNQWWQALFAEGSWQTQNPKIIETQQGILLSKSWESIDEKTWRLAPLTMIMRPSSDEFRPAGHTAEQPPATWVISAEQGATIHFEEPPDITGSSVPTIVRGDLSGAIEVTRQVSDKTQEQPWRLRTSDLVINRTQVSTRQKVRIDWNDSVIEGRELRLLLRGDLLGKQGAPSPDWGPLDELELYHVDTIDLALPAGGIWADVDPRQLNPNSPSPEQLRQMPARLTATCGGRFTFDFKRSTATLQNGVRVVHSLGNLPSDEFLCERITFNLDPPKKTRESENAPSSEASFAGIQFNRIEAVGADSVQDFVGEKWVDLKLPMIDLTARAKRLYVDLSKQRVEFNGQLNHQDATRSTVLLRQRSNEFRSPHIEYQLPPQTQAEEADQPHLGWLFAEGPGELKTLRVDASSASAVGTSQAVADRQREPATSQEIRVRWQKSLRMKPVADAGPGTHWIELLGNTLIESQHEGFLTSERLEIWLAPPDSQTLTSAAPLPGESQSSSYRPQRIYSAAPTTLATPNLRA